MPIGLRERKRRQVAHELARAAFDLAVERGLNGFTIEELTDQAGYARRTFTNYYSCKEEAVTALALEQLQAGAASLPEENDDLPLIDWIARLAKHQLSNGLMDVLEQLTVLSEQNPTLEPYLTRVYAEIPMSALNIVHDRFSEQISPRRISILIGAVYGALTMVLTQTAPGEEDPPPHSVTSELLDQVFSQLKSGFQE